MAPGLIALIVVLVALFIIGFPIFVTPVVIYITLLVRTSKKKWRRDWPRKDAEESQMMEEGKVFGEENKDYIRIVQIENEGYKLFANYVDFGSDKAVIVIPGRSEAGSYGYYFSEIYKKNGYNILSIDNRAHGLSSGVINRIGFEEYKDILAWGRYLHDNLGIKEVIIHAICIGSSMSLYALTDDSCPDYMKAMVAEGMYVNFAESFANHIREARKPLFPIHHLVMLLIRIFSHKSPTKFGPINCIGKMKKPILFLYSKMDAYSTPDQAQLLYDSCHAPKQLVWFDKGVHSHIRINNTQQYDDAVDNFIHEFIEK